MHGFHHGELAVQRIAGVHQEAARLEGMLAPADLSPGMAGFLAERSFAAITARDHGGRLWTSPLVGAPGFLQAVDPTTLQIRTAPAVGDPLHLLPSGQPVGLIAIDYIRRRRFRLNGTLTVAVDGRLEVAVDEAFGNCPQFIPQRTVDLDAARPADVAVPLGPPTAADEQTISTTTSFLLGTTHPQRGNDVSHRGGAAGFLRRQGDTLWWPDYPGNNLFNSLGNLHVDPEAALLVPDFERGLALHLHGTAELVITGATEDEGHTGRRIVFSPESHVRTLLPVISRLISDYPRNPNVGP
ncbi:pyridoxamine 5'-phosphate oxidase family protein [Marmoricola sp. RAF53]|uniref:pyridoxamine 5'-phosphate oxidase family protein n=1 Tax=Marmoricola sp. RAF53 TaxID=3233059 RepID=UPI003F9B2385